MNSVPTQTRVSSAEAPGATAGVLRYCPVVDRRSQTIGYRLFVCGQRSADGSFRVADPIRDALSRQVGELLDGNATTASDPTSSTFPPARPGIHYWLPATPALLDSLAPRRGFASCVVWLLDATTLTDADARGLSERAIRQGHRIAVVGTADALIALQSMSGLTALHLLGETGKAYEMLYRCRREGALLIDAIAGFDGMPNGQGTRAPTPAGRFDGREGFVGIEALPPAQQSVAPAYGFVLKALKMLQTDARPQQIEHVLRADPVLVFRLLRYANAAAFRGSVPIDRLADAITRVGSRQFSRWLALALVTSQVDRGGRQAQIARAVVRGEMMESLVPTNGPLALRDAAFIVGLFSLIEEIVGAPLPALLDSAAVPAIARLALLDRKGDAYPLLAQTMGSEWSPSVPHRDTETAAVVDPSLSRVDLALIEALRAADGLI